MDARSSSPRTSSRITLTKKPKKDIFAKRKPLGNNLRSIVKHKKDIPPLTPLHRLQRFKAIRDKNLKRRVKESLFENNMEEKTETHTTIEVHKQIIVTEEEETKHTRDDVSPSNLKIINSEKTGNVDFEEEENVSSTNSNEQMNGENGLLSSNDENLSNGHKENVDDNPAVNGFNDIISSFEKSESVKLDDDDTNSLKVEVESVRNDLEVDVEKVSSDGTKEGSVESDHSSSSSSTFKSNKHFTISSDEEGSIGNKTESNKEEDNDVDNERDDASTKSDEKSEDSAFIGFQDYPSKEKSMALPSRIPRSTSSASSYKSAHGSLSRISGRRPVNGLYRPVSRKRKAEEQADMSSNNKRAGSPSYLSPRWKFFPSSVSKLWSPRKTPFVFSGTSTPMRNLEDSLAVNVDEDTINSHLNDTDLFSDARESPPLNKKSKWGCTVM